MNEHRTKPEALLYDRALLLHGSKRNDLLTLEEVRRYGSDSFSDPDFARLYGMTPAQWYARGVRLLGRTAVECTRDAVADRIGQNVAAIAASLPVPGRWVVVDPFAGSCNTLYWILRHVPQSRGIAFEFDPQSLSTDQTEPSGTRSGHRSEAQRLPRHVGPSRYRAR
jgi:hypothetical protein